MNLAILDVAIGLVLIYLLLSLVCSALLEAVNEFFNRRGAALEKHLKGLMGEEVFAEFCTLPGFASLKSREPKIQEWIAGVLGKVTWKRTHRIVSRLQEWVTVSRFPSYIPDVDFARLACAWHQKQSLGSEWHYEHEFGRSLTRLKLEIGEDEVRFRTQLAAWFNSSMSRMAGRFRSKTNVQMGIVALLVVWCTNADTLRLANDMYRDPTVRNALVEQAKAKVQTDAKGDAGSTWAAESDNLKKDLAAVHLLGWSETEPDRWSVPGYLITVLALMMGADFWFNALRNMVRIRTSLKPEETKEKEQGGVAGGAGAAPITQRPQPAGQPPSGDLLVSALVYARASAFAYEDDAVELPSALRDNGYDKGPSFSAITGVGKGTQGRFLEHADHRVLCFRGTEPSEMADIGTDLCVKLGPLPLDIARIGGLQTHQGFANALASVWQTIVEYLGTQPPKPLVITGHSLGGALAVLAGFALHHSGKKIDIKSVYTYGQPRVGNVTFALAYNSLFQTRHWRVVNNRDMVTRVPPRSSGYRHTGRTLYFDSEGIATVDPTGWLKFLDRVSFAADRDWLGQLLENGFDHPIARYIEILENPR